jgi:hypothetical protein
MKTRASHPHVTDQQFLGAAMVKSMNDTYIVRDGCIVFCLFEAGRGCLSWRGVASDSPSKIRQTNIVKEQTNKRTNKRTNERTNEQKNKRTNEQTNKQTNKQTNERTNGGVVS